MIDVNVWSAASLQEGITREKEVSLRKCIRPLMESFSGHDEFRASLS